MTTEPLLRASGLCAAFDGPDVLHDVGIELPAGAITAIAGANGSGKSTLIEILAGVRTPRAGRVDRFADVALVVQRISASEALPLTVREVVAMGTWGAARRSRSAARAAVAAALDDVGMSAHARRSIHELSGGQRQRVLFAQALARGSRVLLLDEPAAGLDPASRTQMRVLLRRAADRGCAVAWVTHDGDDILACDRVVRLVDGRRAE